MIWILIALLNKSAILVKSVIYLTKNSIKLVIWLSHEIEEQHSENYIDKLVNMLINMFWSDHMFDWRVNIQRIYWQACWYTLIWSHDCMKWEFNRWILKRNHLIKLYLQSLSLSHINFWSDARTEQANSKKLSQILFFRSDYTSLNHDLIEA